MRRDEVYIKESIQPEEKLVPVEIIVDMKVSALGILERIKGGDAGKAQNAMQDYSALVDRFYRANEHLMAPQQYEAARVNFEYFLRLLELAIYYSATGGQVDQATI